MEWGFGGSGPADLALSIMAHANDVSVVSAPLYQSFKQEVVSRLDQSGFRLTSSQVQEWLGRRWSKMDEESIRADFQAA